MKRLNFDALAPQIRTLWPDRTVRHYEIAARLGISENRLTTFARRLGLADRRQHQFRNNQRIRIRNVEYENAREAARILNVTEHTIHGAVAAGREDYVGMGKARPHRKAPGGKPKPLTIGPYTWPTQKAAALDLGVCYSAISKYLSTGQHDKLMALAMALQARQLKEKAA